MSGRIKENRLGEEKLNNKGYPMKIVEYNSRNDIVVEFQDEYKSNVHTTYYHFQNGNVKNPYNSNNAGVYGVGIKGGKYHTVNNGEITKEYRAWKSILRRCFDVKTKNERPTYKDVTCCEEWLLYENFYKWLHSQENFDKWLNGYKWAVDKDILIKGNKIYSPNSCCLVPMYINTLFAIKNKNSFDTQEELDIYKQDKENNIKKIAKEEYDNGNITKECYVAMMNYEVEIVD